MSKYFRQLTALAAVIIAVGLLTLPFFNDLVFVRWIVTIGAGLYVLSVSYAIWKEDDTQTAIEIDKARVKRLEVVAVLVAAVGGLFALDVYQTSNVLAVRNALETRDSHLREIYHTDNGKRLMQIFANNPGTEVSDDASCKQLQGKIDPSARSAVLAVVAPTKRGNLPQWRSIRDLYDTLWDPATASLEGMDDIRIGFFHTATLFYIIYDAYRAREGHIFSNEEYEMWATYIDDLGTSPYLLMVVMDGHEYGYMTKDFSKELWRRFSKRNNRRLHCFAQVLYPKLVASTEKEWMKDWGTRRFSGNRRLSDTKAEARAVQ